MRRIGEFVVEEKLSDSGAGVVRYRSSMPGVDTKVVLQLVRVSATDEAFNRAAKELKALHSVQSPHVIPLLAAGSHEGHLYTVVPFYPEGSLAEPATDLDGRISAVADAALGVHDLHEHGIVHRDVRPESIVRSQGVGLIAELGLVAILAPGATTTGFGPLGTLDYTDPQLLMGQRAQPSNDIWSLGATLHRVGSGESIWPGVHRLSAAEAIRRLIDTRPVISDRVPLPLRSVIECALAPDPTERFATAADFAGATRRGLRDLAAHAASTDAPPLFTMRSSQ